MHLLMYDKSKCSYVEDVLLSWFDDCKTSYNEGKHLTDIWQMKVCK